MNVRALCLAILFFGDRSGYDIRKMSVDGQFSFFINASYGSIYPALNKLKDEGLVTFQLIKQDGKPDRKLYSITEKGRQAFRDELFHTHKPDAFHSEFLLLSIFAHMIGPDATKKAIDLQLQYLEEEMALINASEFEEKESSKMDTNRERTKCLDPASKWALDYGHHCVQAAIDYLRDHGDELIAIASHSHLK